MGGWHTESQDEGFSVGEELVGESGIVWQHASECGIGTLPGA